MQNKYWIGLILFWILIGLIGLAIGLVQGHYSPIVGWLANNGTILANVTAFLMLISNGTLIRTLYFKWILVFMVGIAIGAALKLMHWPLANEILSSSLAIIVGIYTIHFVKKPQRQFIDTLKWFWVLLFATFKILVFFHVITREAMLFVTVVFWLMVIVHLIVDKRKSQLMERE